MGLLKGKRARSESDARGGAESSLEMRPTAPERASDAPSTEDMLEQAMERWGDMVLRLALSQLGHRSDAEDVFQDVFQDVFLRLLKQSEGFSSDEHMKAWLLRVTLNRCHDLQRPAWCRKAEPLGDHDVSVEGHAIDGLLASEVWSQVAALPIGLRTVVHLRYVEDLPTREIARLLGCEPATVRTRLHRARRALRTALEGQERMASAAASEDRGAREASSFLPVTCPSRVGGPSCADAGDASARRDSLQNRATKALGEGGCHA